MIALDHPDGVLDSEVTSEVVFNFLCFVCRYGAEPEAQLNPKKKIFEKISPDLRTNADGVAQYKSVPFMTSKGAVVSELTNAAVK